MKRSSGGGVGCRFPLNQKIETREIITRNTAEKQKLLIVYEHIVIYSERGRGNMRMYSSI